jgi:formate dehydrogenase subunit gamma
MAKNELVLKYRMAERVLHWGHAFSFGVLLITGLFLFFPPLSFLAQDSWSRVIHRICSILFVMLPVVILFTSWTASWRAIFEAANWSLYDLGWVLAFPRYYFLCDEGAMPPQDRFNTGQKAWYIMVLIFSPVFVFTGALMWFGKDILPGWVFQWSIYIHDLCFMVTICMFLVHVYLSVLHPLMLREGGSFRQMVDGKMTLPYAKSHHGKWFDRIYGGAKAEPK